MEAVWCVAVLEALTDRVTCVVCMCERASKGASMRTCLERACFSICRNIK